MGGERMSRTHGCTARSGVRGIAVASALMVIFASGCTTAAAEPWEGHVSPWEEEVSVAIEEATEGGASDAQIAILEKTRETGEVTFEDAKAAMVRTVECFADVGIDATYKEEQDSRSVTLPSFTAVVTDEPDYDEPLDPCDTQESFWVNMLYLTQPSALEAMTQQYAPLVPAIKECLAREGVEFDETTENFWDLVEPSQSLFLESGQQVDCMAEAGVGSY